jgi:hypothetical protein
VKELNLVKGKIGSTFVQYRIYQHNQHGQLKKKRIEQISPCIDSSLHAYSCFYIIVVGVVVVVVVVVIVVIFL